MSIFCLTSLSGKAQEIKLPVPDKTGGISVMEAFWQRKTDRKFSNKVLSEKELSNLLWAACGVNRADSGKRTNPTANNAQEISVYVFLSDCVCMYDHSTHSLKTVVDGDHRNILAMGQDFVLQVPVTLVIVVDMEKFGDRYEMMQPMGAADAGIVSQNINLFCAAYGLCTVTRGTMNREAVSKLLGLTEKQIPMLNNPVGHGK